MLISFCILLLVLISPIVLSTFKFWFVAKSAHIFDRVCSLSLIPNLQFKSSALNIGAVSVDTLEQSDISIRENKRVSEQIHIEREKQRRNVNERARETEEDMRESDSDISQFSEALRLIF